MFDVALKYVFELQRQYLILPCKWYGSTFLSLRSKWSSKLTAQVTNTNFRAWMFLSKLLTTLEDPIRKNLYAVSSYSNRYKQRSWNIMQIQKLSQNTFPLYRSLWNILFTTQRCEKFLTKFFQWFRIAPSLVKML